MGEISACITLCIVSNELKPDFVVFRVKRSLGGVSSWRKVGKFRNEVIRSSDHMAGVRERNRLYKKVIKDLKSWHKYFWSRISERLTISVSKVDVVGKPMVKIVIGQASSFGVWL